MPLASPGAAHAADLLGANDDLPAWLRLTLSPGIGGATARRLLARFGGPGRIFQAPEPELASMLTGVQALSLRQPAEALNAQVDATQRWLAQDRARRAIITLADPRYPRALLETADPPLLLYAMGEPLAVLAAQAQAPHAPDAAASLWPEAIALVGSRNPTPQGELNARQFARCFAGSGLAVVSGLARGIDAAAHEGALEAAGGPRALPGILTIAVVGTGLDRVYPARHQALAGRIAQQGLVLSEYPLGTPPLSENFPRRNRIIAALGRGTLVVEAALKSGSLITAACALEQGREVFAIPGSIHSPQSRGCHALIKQGAKLVETAQDVLEELAYPCAGGMPPRQSDLAFAPAGLEAGSASLSGPSVSGPAIDVLRALGFEAASLDNLLARTGLDVGRLQAGLLELELAGEVVRLPGGLYQRQVRA